MRDRVIEKADDREAIAEKDSFAKTLVDHHLCSRPKKSDRYDRNMIVSCSPTRDVSPRVGAGRNFSTIGIRLSSRCYYGALSGR